MPLVKLKLIKPFSLSLCLTIILIVNTSFVGASTDRIGDLVNQDIQNRMFVIHQTVHDLNDAEVELDSFRVDLNTARKAIKIHHATQVVVRDSAAVIAAIGFIGTSLYRSRGINPGKVVLWGGYGLTAIASIVGLLENHTINLDATEITKLAESVIDLEKRVDIEKANLARELRLLCGSLKNSHSACLL